VAVLLAVLVVCGSNPVFAGCEFAKLLASDGAESDNFGNSVCIWGDKAIVGSPYDDDKGSGSGSAYIFRFNGTTWVQEAKLLAADGAAGDNFGQSVGICGNTAVAGAVGDDDKGNNSGSAYIFRFNGSSWVQEMKVVAPDGAPSNYFGQSVGVSGNTVVVGAYYDDDNGSASGSAHIYRFNGSTWAWETKLLASDGGSGNYFGYAVGIDNNAIVIGAYGDDDNGIYSGSAYIFRFNGSSWAEQAKLLASDGAENDYFGYSVGISGDTTIIGAYLDNNGSDSGSAYIFRFDGSNWAEEDKLLASDSNESDYFGRSVGIWGDTAVVGATGDDDMGEGSGSAYVFRFDGSSWVQDEKLLACDGADYDLLGVSASIWGDEVVIGAMLDDDSGASSGSAYIFDLSINPSDLNSDGDVDFVDYGILASYWLERTCGPFGCDGTDLTGDGRVDSHDLKKLCNSWLAESTAASSGGGK
jgi:hypothetical protein